MKDQQLNDTSSSQPYQAPIKVIGVGGGGSNAVNTMFNRGIQGVDFIVCNTDSQALEASPVIMKVQLGATLTGGQGAGSLPEVGRNAAIETLDEIKDLIGTNTSMVFITAGMGGGTGTGAAPIIAQAAREMNILTVGIVTIPFQFEGRRRSDQAKDGLDQMREAVDTLLIIRNDKLRELYGNLTIRKAFANADDILCTAAKGIAEVITLTGEINVDMNDVNTVMRNSGRAIMGSGMASGEGRARAAVTDALESPLLNDCDITGANFVLLNITFGTEEILMDEIMEITDVIQEAAGQTAEVIWGYGVDESLDADLSVTVIATGFQGQEGNSDRQIQEPKRFMLNDKEREITTPVEPTQSNASEESKDAPYLMPHTEESSTSNAQKWNLDLPNQSNASDDVLPLISETEESSSKIILQVEEGLKFSLSSNEVVEEPLADLTPTDDAPRIAPEQGDEPNVVIHSLDSDPLPLTSDAPDLEDITFHESSVHAPQAEAPSTPTPPITPPLSHTGISHATPSSDSLPNASETGNEMPPAEREKTHVNRTNRIQQYTRKLKTPGGLADLEAEPAFKRRQVKLDDIDHSTTSQVSRFSLNESTDEDGERHTELRNDNPFLHDNVD